LPREIDENLKRAYQARLEEGIPDRFAALLEALRENEAGQHPRGSAGKAGAPEPGASGGGRNGGSTGDSTGGAA